MILPNEITEQRRLADLQLCKVTLISPGSQVVKLLIITTISRVAWAGMCFKVCKATSNEFCNEGSPEQFEVAAWAPIPPDFPANFWSWSTWDFGLPEIQ